MSDYITRYKFRAFNPYSYGKRTIRINDATVRGDWIYFDIFGHAAGGLYRQTETPGEYMRLHFVQPGDIIPATIGQRKGMDANGEEIYTGDIVIISTDTGQHIGVVVEGNPLTQSPIRDYQYPDTYYTPQTWESCEIANNIWENSELLKGR